MCRRFARLRKNSGYVDDNFSSRLGSYVCFEGSSLLHSSWKVIVPCVLGGALKHLSLCISHRRLNGYSREPPGTGRGLFMNPQTRGKREGAWKTRGGWRVLLQWHSQKELFLRWDTGNQQWAQRTEGCFCTELWVMYLWEKTRRWLHFSPEYLK